MTVEPGVGVGQDSDASVVERSCDEPEAFAVLFDRHADSLHRCNCPPIRTSWRSRCVSSGRTWPPALWWTE
ncbi:hypothetical protein SALBM311S_09309 [Streptomyces alboniger]